MTRFLIASVILCLAGSAGCGGDSDSTTTTSTGGTASSGTGGAGGGGGQGGSGGAAPTCESGTARALVLLHTTLDDLASVIQPEVGSGQEASVDTNPPNDFVPAIHGNGIQIDAAGEHVRFRQFGVGGANLNPARGALDFCYLPSYDHTDGVDHALLGAEFNPGMLRIRKAGTSASNRFEVIAGNGTNAVVTSVPAASYALVAGTWARITVSWDYTVGDGQPQVHVYIDGVEVVDPDGPTGPFPMPLVNLADFLYLGAISDGTTPPWNASGVIDELVIYGEPIVP